jgi:starch synthase
MSLPRVISVNFSTSGAAIGGAANAALQFSEAVAEFLPHSLFRMWDEDNVSTNDNGLTIRSFTTLYPFFAPKRSALGPVFCYSLIREALAVESFDILHVHNIIPSLHLLRVCLDVKLRGKRIVFSSHGLHEVFHPSYGFSFVQLFAWYLFVAVPVWISLYFADHIFLSYPDQRREIPFLGKFHTNFSALPNGPNPTLVKSKTSETDITAIHSCHHIDKSLPCLLYVGNHTQNKGFDVLHELVTRLDYECNIIIAGRIRNHSLPSLFNDASSRSVNVVFTDFLLEEDLNSLYWACDLLLFPSKSDTLPLSIIDAMACSMPVVAYKLPGIKHLLGDTYPMYAEEFTHRGFINAVERYFLMPASEKLNLGNSCNKRQKRLFEWYIASRNALNVYGSLSLNP